jgi:hypothetical protein
MEEQKRLNAATVYCSNAMVNAVTDKRLVDDLKKQFDISGTVLLQALARAYATNLIGALAVAYHLSEEQKTVFAQDLSATINRHVNKQRE